ncbi:atrial natriuretic peptide receptor 2-like, partial [Littorina saxatilis]|uniref:atrial natriuretic peptide receptor 2-like n=1 Tax=Littorina saxatilis TaxID=31220 RepID=UPI0038B4DF35
HIKLEAELAQMNWRVRWEDILFGSPEKNKKLERQGSKLSLVKRGSCTSSVSGDTLAFQLSDAGNRQLFTKTGYYKGAIIAIKSIPRTNITISKPLLLEIKRDVLENDQIKLDWMFRYSIMQDIVRGMAYLHGTDLRSHGNLKSTNCVVDSRFVVKITDFGLHYFRFNPELTEEENNYSSYHKKLWTAPELLRMQCRPPEGTQKGDVYSFAIVCQEIVYRNGVFYLSNLDLSPQ